MRQGKRLGQNDRLVIWLKPWDWQKAVRAQAYPAQELAALYAWRWHIELWFRDIKTSMGMEEYCAARAPRWRTRNWRCFSSLTEANTQPTISPKSSDLIILSSLKNKTMKARRKLIGARTQTSFAKLSKMRRRRGEALTDKKKHLAVVFGMRFESSQRKDSMPRKILALEKNRARVVQILRKSQVAT